MKIIKRIVLDASGTVVEERSYEYYGPIARAKGQSSTSQAQTNYPAWVAPYAQDFLQQYHNLAFDQYGRPIAMPSNLTMQQAEFAPQQKAAFQYIQDLTPQAQALSGMGAGDVVKTLSGTYLDPNSNPYLQSTYNTAARSLTDQYSMATQPGLMAAAQRAGQFGGSAMDETMALSRYDLGQNLGNLANQIYGQNYQTERDRMMAANQLLPQTIQNMYAPSTALAGVGAQVQQQAQTGMDIAYQNAAQQAEWPFNIMNAYGNALAQAVGGTGQSTTNVTGTRPGFMGSLICTELYRQGLMDDWTYAADTIYGAGMPDEVIRGYQWFARPIVKAMRRSPLITAVIAPIVLSWARTMRARIMGHPENETLLGRFMLKYGVPLAGWLGRMK